MPHVLGVTTEEMPEPKPGQFIVSLHVWGDDPVNEEDIRHIATFNERDQAERFVAKITALEPNENYVYVAEEVGR